MADYYVEKHLARNVPMNFMECCKRIRREFDSRVNDDRQLYLDLEIAPKTNYNVVYGGMISMLFDSDIPYGKDEEIGLEVSEVEVRFEVLKRTVDFSVRVSPISDTLTRLARSAHSTREKLADKERDVIVKGLMGMDGEEPLPNSISDFRSAQSLAERVAIANRIVEDLSPQLDELKAFFDYKRGLVRQGQPSKYAMLYAVHALADIFERHNNMGRSAIVGETVNTDQNVAETGIINERRYTGPFLGFVTAFYRKVNSADRGFSISEGFKDSVRGIAQNRKNDADLHKLLHGEDVAPEHLLRFMKRADALKNS